MTGRKKMSGKISDGVQNRMQRVEALVEDVALRLGQIESQFKQETGRAREVESKILSQIAEAQRQVSATSGGQNLPESFIALEEESAVDLDGWEKKMDEKYAALCAKESQLQELEKRISGELEKLLSEIKQRDLLLAAREEELTILKQSVASRLNEIEIRIAKRSGATKPARLVSFLVDIGKKH